MYQATAAAFIPLPIMETTFAAKTKRSPFFCKIERMIYFKQWLWDSPSVNRAMLGRTGDAPPHYQHFPASNPFETLKIILRKYRKGIAMDPFSQFKELQKQGWAHFAPLQAITTPAAARLVKYASIRQGHEVLDVACGTGVVALTAARLGARVSALDLTPELLAHARENADIAKVEVDWHEGDVENLPFQDSNFDVVVSQFGHMFAPRPEVAIGEMLRVLKPGGIIAFSTWPPELLVGRSFGIVGRYAPPPPPGVVPPPLWGDPNIVKERLGGGVKQVAFDRARMNVPALSLQHFRKMIEETAGPILKLVELLSTNASKLDAFRSDYDALVAEYFEDNVVHQDYLLTRAIKA
jgi:SAM-dependent methyltransferase